MASFHFCLLFMIFLNIAVAELLLEDGYTVSTVLDGHKQKMNPHAVVARPGSSDLVILDSVSSAFYIASFPLPPDSVVKPLSGGVAGYSDGEAVQAMFNKPRSFDVDTKGNVYVADKNNHAIRKISYSGTVTTIAGGYSKKVGREDGPAQNASFSNDFELAFVPGRCALLVSDHGNQLIREIKLREEDCTRSSHSALGAASVWAIGLGLSCLLGMAIGFAVRHYVFPRKNCSPLRINATWKHFLINLAKQVQTLCYDIRSATAKSLTYSLMRRFFWLTLSQLSLIFRVTTNVGSKTITKDLVSLLDPDNSNNSHEVKSSEMIVSRLNDSLNLDGSLELRNVSSELMKQESSSLVLLKGGCRIDEMIEANIAGFLEVATSAPPVEVSVSSSGLVKRT